MFQIIEKIDRLIESQTKCTLIDKMGKYYHGVISESWVRASGGKLRGKLRFTSEEKGVVEIDANDILDIIQEVDNK